MARERISISRPSEATRCGIVALACIRGGGEYGEAWHRAGQFERKQNVFDDFIVAAEHLIREKYASPSTLAISGGSNGGLLVGAVMTQRPELFAAAVPDMGVMDMLRWDRLTGGNAWATEFGASSDPKAFAYLKGYSPLHNIKAGTCYPSTLIATADHDDRVVPSHSFKFAATMQAVQAATPNCMRPVLIRVETQASHGYRPLDKRIAELAASGSFPIGAPTEEGRADSFSREQKRQSIPPLRLRAVRSPARWLETHERAKELLPRSPSGLILIGGRSLVWVHSVRLVVLAFLFNGENVRPRLVPPIHQHPCASSSSPTCVSTVMV